MAGKDGQATTVGARKLQDLLRALPDDAHDQRRCFGQQDDGARWTLALQPADARREPITRASASDRSSCRRCRCRSSDLRALLQLAEFAMAQQDIQVLPERHAARRRQGHAAGGRDRRSPAVVGEHLAVGGDYTRQEVILPRKTVLELSKLLDDSDTTGDASTSSRTRRASASATSSSCRRSSTASFPITTASSRSGHSKKIELERADAAARALQRAAILSNEKFRGVRLVLADGQLQASSARTASRKRPKKSSTSRYSGDALDIGFNITYLLDVLAERHDGQGVPFAFGDAELERARDAAGSRGL